jgi:hypothetical protein
MVSSKTRTRFRHVLVRYRRPLAALAAFSSVLLTIVALRPAGSAAVQGPIPSSDGSQSSSWQTVLGDSLVAAPVRLADADVVTLIHPGSVVDILAADGKGHATVVASSVKVIEVPKIDSGALAASSFGGALVVVAVSPTVATSLAATASVGPLSLVVRS